MLNEEYFKEFFLHTLSQQFQCIEPASHFENGATVLSDAFPLAVLPDFLDEESAKSLLKTLQSLPFKHKAMDLFDFDQSPDLKSFLNQPENPITTLCKEIFSPAFTSAVSKVIGKPLGTEIDFAAQCYNQAQYLLCHDDRLESRRVAFVLYLVDETWSADKDGGQIELFRTNYKGEPSPKDSLKFVPSWNTFVFFEVSMWSHHQVCEVIGNLPRFSLAGWLHDPKTTKPIETHSVCESPSNIEDHLLLNIKQLIKSNAYDLEPILTPNGSFERLFFHKQEPKLLLDLIKQSLRQNMNSDWPNLPVLLKFSLSKHFLKSYSLDYMFEEEEHRLIHIAYITIDKPDSEIRVNGSNMAPGHIHKFEATSKDAPSLSIETTDLEFYLVIWSIKLISK